MHFYDDWTLTGLRESPWKPSNGKGPPSPMSPVGRFGTGSTWKLREFTDDVIMFERCGALGCRRSNGPSK